jgi:hypothetical protein
MPTKRIDTTVLPDGTLEVRTPDEGQPHFAEARAREDAELQAALDTLRGQGVTRPVLVHLADGDKVAVTTWKQLLPAMRGRGIPIFSTGPGDFSYFFCPNVAREILYPLVGRGVMRLFRTAQWPLSYHTVEIASNGHLISESQTFKDAARAERG